MNSEEETSLEFKFKRNTNINPKEDEVKAYMPIMINIKKVI